MSILDKNVSPYFDDFDAAKNYFQVIFNPARAVQTRELSQISSTLQNQISSLGNHFFKDGTSIHEAVVKSKNDKVVLILDGVTSFAAGDFLGKTIGNGTLNSEENKGIVTSEDVAGQKLFIEIRGGIFTDGMQLRILDVLGHGYDKDPLSDPYTLGGANPYQVTIASLNGVVTDALTASVSDGILYVSGYFAVVAASSIIVDDTGSNGSYKIGFTFTEQFITDADDNTLRDNSAGSLNFNAPGADRVQGVVTLISYKLADYGSIPTNFFSIIEIDNGIIIKDKSETQYADLLDLLARRTYNQAGHYVTKEFPISLNTNSGDDTQLDYNIGAGKAVISGYEVGGLRTAVKTVSKPRDDENLSASIDSTYGPYIEVGLKDTATDNAEFNMQGLFDVGTKQIIYFWASVDGGGATSQLLGQGRVLGLRRENKTLRVYFRDGDDAGANKITNKASIFSVSTDGTPGGNTYVNAKRDAGSIVKGLENPNFLFPIGTKATKLITNNSISYEVNTKYTNVVPVVDAAEWRITLTAPDNYTDFESTNPYGIIVITNNSTGVVLTQNLDASRTPVVTNTDGVASTINIFLDTDPVNNVDVAIRMDRHAQDGNSKTKAFATVTESLAFTYNNASGNTITLANHDVLNIVSIKTNPGAVAINLTNTNITLDGGQRDYEYLVGEITIPAGEAELTNAISYDVEYRHYTHSGSGEHFDVNSYPDYDNIETYTTEDGKKNVELRDTLDFRRTTADNLAGGVLTVHPNVSITVSSYDRYLPRRDAITLDERGNYVVYQGSSEVNPKMPNVPGKSLVLYTIDLPAYVYSTRDVEVNRVDNKNYTMEEIGNLEKRISKMEKTTAISYLERQANDKTLQDVNGLDKFKNGIMVDAFTGHGIGNVRDSEYYINIDKIHQLARTPTKLLFKDFGYISLDSTSVVEHDNITTLSYTTTPVITQLQSSEAVNVNPFNVFLWSGGLVLNPPSDNWIDTNFIGETIKSIENNAAWDFEVAALEAEYDFGIQWDGWSETWLGYEKIGEEFGAFSGFLGLASRKPDYYTWVTVENSYQRDREGINTYIGSETQLTTIGDRVVSTDVLLWMRPNNVSFTSTGLQPGIQFKAFFDGDDVTSAITWDAGYQGIDIGGGIFTGITDASGELKGTFAIPGNVYHTGSRVFRLEDNEHVPAKSSSEAVYTANGVLETITTDIVATEVPVAISENVSASETFTEQGSIRKTRYIDPVAQSFLVTDEGGIFVSSIDLFFKYKDANLPVSIAIVPTINGSPSQRIVPFSEVTLKPDDAVTIQAIVKEEFGPIISAPNSVDNTDTLLPTTFTFSNPVKLEEGYEYAIVISTNSAYYELYVAETGAIGYDGNLIAQQPYTGVFFKSSNASTWNADQNRDIKFELNRCVFDASGVYALEASSAGATTEPVTAINIAIDTVTDSHSEISWNYQFTEDASAIPTVLKNNIEFSTLRTIPQATPMKVKATLTTDVDNLSPVINNNRMSGYFIANNVDTTATPDSNGRYEAGSYITKTMKMENISDDMRVIFNAIKPGLSEVEVYYKTSGTIPQYVDIEDLTNDSIFYDEFAEEQDYDTIQRDLDKGLTASVYTYEDTGTGTITKLVGTSIISDITNEVGGNNRRLFMKDISDVTNYVDAADAGYSFEKVFISTDASIVDPAADLEYNAVTGYTTGEYVIYLDRIYKSISPSTNTGNTPSQFSTVWEEISTYFMKTGLGIGDAVAVNDGPAASWTSMKIEAGAYPSDDPARQMIEYTYKPEKDLDEEFTSVAFRIDFKAYNKVETPFISAFRAIVTY